MFEKFTSDNIEAFRQRYEGTYGFYKDENGKRLLVQLQDISNHRCSFVDAGGISYHLNPDAPLNIGFEFLPPKSAWYNTDEGAMFCQRIAKRQFSRGVMSGNLSIQLLVGGVLVPKRVSFGSLSAIYEKAMAPKDVFKPVDNTGRSIAVSSMLAFGGKNVYVLSEPVGTFTRSDALFKIKLNEPDLWRTELTDALRHIGATAEIS